MNPVDPNVLRVEVVAAALGDLCEKLVLVGDCAASLLIDAPGAPPARVTYDVDVIAEVAALHGYHALEWQFAKRRFSRDVSEGAPICRWRERDIELDLMPTDEKPEQRGRSPCRRSPLITRAHGGKGDER
jgi:hypothetical protein